MNKLFAFIMILILSTPSWADLLLSPEEEAAERQQEEEGQRNCPKDKPIFDGLECHACDEWGIIRVGRYGKCSEVCPNRECKYMHGPGACVLKDSWYIKIREWLDNL